VTHPLLFSGCENKHTVVEILLFIIPFINSLEYEIINMPALVNEVVGTRKTKAANSQIMSLKSANLRQKKDKVGAGSN
jgi:hypothetical protein